MDELQEKAVSIEKEILTIRAVLDRFQDSIFESKVLIDSCSKKIHDLSAIYDYSLKKEITKLDNVYVELQNKYNSFQLEFEKLRTQFVEYTTRVRDNCEVNKNFYNIKHKEITEGIDRLKNELEKLIDKSIRDLDEDFNRELRHIKESITNDLTVTKSELNKLSNDVCDMEEKMNTTHTGLNNILSGRQMLFGIFTVVCALAGAVSAIFSIYQYIK